MPKTADGYVSTSIAIIAEAMVLDAFETRIKRPDRPDIGVPGDLAGKGVCGSCAMNIDGDQHAFACPHFRWTA